METIKERVKALRLGLRLSQTDLANRCGVTQPSIANIERGRTTEIKGYLLEALAKELNTTPAYILNGASTQVDHESSMMQAEIAAIFLKLSPDDQSALLRTARGMLNTTLSKGTTFNPFPLAKIPAH
jgi:transcriptional regulator with XRE-family HTH domain